MRRIAVLVVVGGIVLLLVLAQLVLPGIAAQRLHDRIARSGEDVHVSVSAFPAIELLWHHADKVVIHVSRYRSTPGNLGSLLSQAGDVGTLDATAGELDTGLLTLRNATLTKRGDQLTGTATVTEADLRTAVPFLDSVQPVASGNGQLTLRGTATLLGVTATVDATVAAQDGNLVVAPDVPLGGLATVTVFDNPHVTVQSVSAQPSTGGFTATAQARVH